VSKHIPIRIDIFESAFKRYQRAPGRSFASLAKAMKVPVAHLRDWRRNGAIPAEHFDKLAEALGTPAGRLVRTPDGALLPDNGHPTSSLPHRVSHNILSVAQTFRSYTRFVGYHRKHPDHPHLHSIHHPGDDHFYGTLFLESSSARQQWLFSVWFGLRLDYGTVKLTDDGEVFLEPILQDQDARTRHGFAVENDSGSQIVTVRTWFGRPSCDFLVQSEKPFNLRWTKEAVDVPGTVTFVKNVFQREE
jgi:hypothetical protein